MAKIANYAALFFAIAMFTIVQSLSGTAFAINQGGQYPHTHATATWNPGFVCGDHKCAAGEIPQPPKAVEPVRAH